MLSDFLAGELPVLIGTDVASRGLHVPDVSHVFNYDLPQDVEDYVHRIGRTARAGASGDAISFGCENYAIYLPDIEKYIGRKIPVSEIDREALSEFQSALAVARPRPRKRPGDGGRPRNDRSRGDRSRGDRPHGSRSRSSGGSGSGGGSSSAASTGAAPAGKPESTGAPTTGGATADGEQKKKRRRRRRSKPAS
jgi:ATP-dependent RNA helicase RhlB